MIEHELTLSELNNWLENFKRQHNRPLRVLHVGNIANNAYLNAKFLREVGVEAEVLCHSYAHVMATPEWEELEINHSFHDEYHPKFSKQDTKNYRRPSWFVQGNLKLCAAYMHANHNKQPFLAKIYWFLLAFFIAHPKIEWIFGFAFNVLLKIKARLFKIRRHKQKNILNNEVNEVFENQTTKIIRDFAQQFPQRKDQLTRADVLMYLNNSKLWLAMFEYYDLVQCYATDPIFACLHGTTPYLAFEHGTLRAFTQDDNPLHRLTAYAYKKAAHVFITNGDCSGICKKVRTKPIFGDDSSD